MTRPPSVLLNPSCWLVYGLPWPSTRSDFAEAAIAVAPTTVPRNVVSRAVANTLDLATAIARDSSNRAVFFADGTRWLDAQQRTWGDLGVDVDSMLAELTEAPILQLYLSMSRLGHALLCDGSRNGPVVHTADGSWQTGPREREELRAQLSATLRRDWPTYAAGVYENRA